MAANAFITGCAGPRLTDAERDFFRDADPWGLILFARNCVDPEQIRALVDAFRDVVGRGDAPILIDQEGGRVQRLKPPVCVAYPSAADIGRVHVVDAGAGRRAAWLLGRLIGEDLYELGITVDCLPVADIRIEGAHDIIGDRSFGALPETIAHLAGAVSEGLSAAGVAPVMKHIPGHGRAAVDSHFDLPRVEEARNVLESSDFEPFRRLSTLPMAMTAHVVYTAIDAAEPATLSPTVVDAIIRDSIGFDGLLMTDDLSMGALSGSLEDRTLKAFRAGCDMVLHCNGEMAEMQAVATQTPALTSPAAERAAAALVWPQREEADIDEARAEFHELLDLGAAAGVA